MTSSALKPAFERPPRWYFFDANAPPFNYPECRLRLRIRSTNLNIMNLYASTTTGIMAVKQARRRRLLEQMAAAALRKGKRSDQLPPQVAAFATVLTEARSN